MQTWVITWLRCFLINIPHGVTKIHDASRWAHRYSYFPEQNNQRNGSEYEAVTSSPERVAAELILTLAGQMGFFG